MGKKKAELLVAVTAMVLFLIGLIGWVFTLLGRGTLLSGGFTIEVVILIAWSGAQWLRLSRRSV